METLLFLFFILLKLQKYDYKVIKLFTEVNDGHANNHLPKYKSVFDVFSRMYKEEGLVAFYRGVYINMVGNTLSNLIFFTIYADGKKRYNYSRENSPFWLTAFISMRAGVGTMLITNPIWVVKTRTMLYLNDTKK